MYAKILMLNNLKARLLNICYANLELGANFGPIWCVYELELTDTCWYLKRL